MFKNCFRIVFCLFFVGTLSAWVTFATKLCTVFCTSFKYYDILFCKLLTLHKLCRFLVGFLKNSANLAKNHSSMMYWIIEHCIMIQRSKCVLIASSFNNIPFKWIYYIRAICIHMYWTIFALRSVSGTCKYSAVYDMAYTQTIYGHIIYFLNSIKRIWNYHRLHISLIPPRLLPFIGGKL